ncbi:hypothetical protein [Flavobacterium sp. CLA17]|uniref:hypothetical protein n=1 Tax=Flavobacterium sp. CLA17 TaxID=2724135 RepID=UPI001490D619|nr:hypothetical protein [Flavobacterium sp. CLA17]QSB29098.1 hypothetical protein HAV12_010270 [Flavobacterium sp. CLA17]
MKNLENLGLVELNAQEVLSIEGGDGWLKWFVEEVVDHWEEIKKGAREGWNAGNR